MMTNMKPTIKEALKTLGYPVTTDYPESMPSLPSITFYEATNQDANASDDEAAEAYIEFYIQVWGNGTEQIEPLSQGVDELMKGMGFWRTFGTDDLSGEVKRKILRYTIMKEA